MKTHCLAIIFLLAAFPVDAQPEFRHGFIVKNNGDTLTGLIFYGLDARFKGHCRFRRFEMLRDIVYGPADLRSYGFRQGRCFESREYEGKRRFFECVIRGPVSLYALPGGGGDRLFVEYGSVGFLELKRGITRTVNGYVFPDFRALLVWLLEKSSIQPARMDTLSYNAASIGGFLLTSALQSDVPVQTCRTTPELNWITDYSLFPGRSRWSGGLTGGVQMYTVNVTGNALTRYFSEANYDKGYRPVIGMYTEFALSKKSELFSVGLAALYLSASYYGYAAYTTLSECRDEIFLDYDALQVPLYLKIRPGGNRLRPFIKAGVYGSLLVESSYRHYAERQFGNEIFTDWFSDFRLKNDYGIHAGLGLEVPIGKVRRLFVEAAYMRGTQLLLYSEDIYSVPMSNKIKSGVISLMFSISL